MPRDRLSRQRHRGRISDRGRPAPEVLATGAYTETVRAEELQAGERDIQAVPTFVVEDRWAIPGANDVDTFVQLLSRARERLAP